MGYPTVSDFDREFIRRTLENLNCQVTNKFTHLMNSLLGLIILPRQWNIQGRREPEFLNRNILEFEELRFLNEPTFFQDDNHNEIETKKFDFKHKKIEDTKLVELLDKMRHTIAHQSIRPTRDGENWRGVIFRSYQTDQRVSKWGEDYNLQLYLTMSEISEFTRFIATKYLEEFNTNLR